MKKHFLSLLLILLAASLMACSYDALSVAAAAPPQLAREVETTQDAEPSPEEIEAMSTEPLTWQDAYAALLMETSETRFALCDIDGDEVPELLIGGPSTPTDKYAGFDVYVFKAAETECIGSVGALNRGSFWIDNNCGILAYMYGAGAGGMFRSYMDNGALYDGVEVSGYYYDSVGNYIEWFTAPDGSEVIVGEETAAEYQTLYDSYVELNIHDISEPNIATVIYTNHQ